MIAFDESQVVHAARANQLVRFLHELVTLGVFFADVEQPDARCRDAKHASRATIEPMVANCASCSAVALVFAPRSRM